MARLRSWWEQIKQRRVAIGVVGIVLVVIALIIAGYWFDWTGFSGYNKVTITHTISGTNAGTVTKTEEYQPGKGLWDWLQLLGVLAIPAVVGLGAAWYTAQQGKVSDRENTDNQRATVLQEYIDKMSELLLVHHLRDSKEDDEVRKIARVRTITILFQLDARRIGYVFSFLREAGLMSNQPNSSIIKLNQADLSNINLSQANLREVDLSGANLSRAYLQRADLSGANLSGTNLSGANLSDAIFFSKIYVPRVFGGTIILSKPADLTGADLSYANLHGAKVTTEQLNQARSLEGATMPDGTIHP